METYQSKFSAQDLDNAIGLVHGLVVPRIGENGNWWVGKVDTGVLAGGVDVTGAEVGQIIKVAEVDENGRPTAWKSIPLPSGGGWIKINEVDVVEDLTYLSVTTDSDGNEFKLRKLFVACEIAVPTDEAWTSSRLIAVAGWYGKNEKLPANIWDANAIHIAGGAKYGGAKTCCACLIDVLEPGRIYAQGWKSVNQGSMGTSLVMNPGDTAGGYYSLFADRSAYWNEPYMYAVNMCGTQACIPAGSKIVIYGVPYSEM